MKYFLLLFTLVLTTEMIAQVSTGSIVGKLTDKEVNNEPLAFANVLIKGTTTGTTSDFDGLYEIARVEPGTYTIVYSYLGYETIEIPNVEVVAGKVTNVDVPMSASAGFELDEVVVTTVSRKDSEVALLLDQKKAIEIKESIGAIELGKIGVSDVATATTKISGVTASQTSGNIYVRGLGDRYLSTTLNGMAIPSDNIDKKNINLSLFPTRVIQNVSISKTFSVTGSADESSGVINIQSRELIGASEFNISASGGINTNVAQSGVFDNFKVSPNYEDATLGFYSQNSLTTNLITQQGWNTVPLETPANYSTSFVAGKKIFKDKLAVILTGAHSRSHGYQQGEFRQSFSNAILDSISDATTYTTNILNSALLDATYYINDKNKVKSSTFFINRLTEEIFEGGRNGEAGFFEETAPAENLSQFIRDQNTKQTNLFVTQLLGTHLIGKKNTLDWAIGYNLLNADEPNRIRNEVNFDPDGTFVQLGRNGGFQQRKSSQEIEDTEWNGYLKDAITIIDEEKTAFKIQIGGSYRSKLRDFSSEFVGVEETSTNAINPPSIDNLEIIFVPQNFIEDGPLEINLLGRNANNERKDIYDGELESYAFFSDFNVNLNKWNFNAGLRYQEDEIVVDYDIGNIQPREGTSEQSYNNFYPSLNVKYSINDLHSLRFAASRTIILPEFKEIAPFEYVSPNSQITRGNVDIRASTAFNYDLKWEYFPSAGQLISLAAFYKEIEDPINRVRDRGSAGIFSYFNTAEQATVYGLEAEAKLDIIKASTDQDGNAIGNELGLVFNATRMWHTQDLKEEFDDEGNLIRSFQYKLVDETGLEGASDWIFNTSLNFNTVGENKFAASLTANYASDRIFALGVPTDQVNRDIFYDDAIIENGFVILDAVLSKEFSKKWKVTLTAQNLLNPEIKQTQKRLRNQAELDDLSIEQRIQAERIEQEFTVLSYDLGINLSLGLSYTF